MFKKNEGNRAPLLSIAGESAQLEGKFNITESIQIECEVAGEINVEGKLVIGNKGVVRARPAAVGQQAKIRVGRVAFVRVHRVAAGVRDDHGPVRSGLPDPFVG